MEYMDNDEMDNKEVVLNNIESLNHMDLAFYLTNCEQIARAWQNYKKSNSKAPYFIIENIDGSKKFYIVEGKDNEETERTKSSYDDAISQYEILQNDEDVIGVLEGRIREIEYDEESEESRAEAAYVISTILRLEVVKQRKRDNNWSGIQKEIVKILEQMTVRDLLTTLEWSGQKTMIKTQIFSDELVKRIPEMTEEEFIRYLTNINIEDYFIYNNAETAISNKIQSMTPSLAQKYLQLIKSRTDILEIVDKAEKNNVDMVEVLLETLDSDDLKVKEKNQELIAKLSEEQVVRLLLMGSKKNPDETCDKLLAERLGNVSNVMLEALLMAYLDTERIIIFEELKNIFEQRGKFEINEDGVKVFAINGIDEAQDRASLFEIELMRIQDKSYEWIGDKVKEQIYQEFRTTNKRVDVMETSIRYIKKLQLVNETTLINLINKINIPIQHKTTKTEEDTIDLWGLRNIIGYIKYRILKIEDMKSILKLSEISLESGAFAEAIKERIERFELECGRININVEEYDFEPDDSSEEELLSDLESIYPVTVVAYLLECMKFVEQWEENHKNYSESHGEKEHQMLRQEYKKQKEFCRLLKESTDVQEQLLKIIETLEYDNEDEKAIIKVIYTLAGMIKIGSIFGKDSEEQTESAKEMWQDIKDAIAEKLGDLTTKDFISVLELAGADILLETIEYQEVIVEKILEMTEIEFMKYLVDTGEYEKVEAIKLAEKEKLKIADPVFAQLYVYNDVEPDTVLRLLDGTKSFDKIEVLSSIVNFDDDRVIEKALQMLRGLTTEQIVKYFAISKSDEIDSRITEILIERLRELSDDDIKTLLCVYKYQQDEEFQSEVLKCAMERGICKSYDDIVETKEISTRIISIQETLNAIDGLPISILGVCWEYVGQIDNDEVDVIEWLLDDYQKNSEAVEAGTKYWEYIRRLSNMDLKSLIKTIMKVNQQVRKEKEEFEKNSEVNVIDEDEIDDEEEREEENYDIMEQFETKESARLRFSKEILNSLEIYLKNRILEAEDEQTIKMLGLIFIDEREPFHNVVKEKLRQILTRRRDTTGNEENGGGRE